MHFLRKSSKGVVPFSRGSQPKPSFATVTGRGDNPSYIFHPRQTHVFSVILIVGPHFITPGPNLVGSVQVLQTLRFDPSKLLDMADADLAS